MTSWTRLGAALAGALVLAGCEGADRRLENLAVGLPKDSVLVAMGGAAPQRTVPYLSQGQYIEVMYYPRAGKTDSASMADRKMSPVVLVDGKVVGWGWVYWDSVASANSISVAPREER